MSSREKILNKLRRQIVEQTPLPDVSSGSWIRYADPIQQLHEVVQFVGGTCIELESRSELGARLDQFEQWRQAKRIFSAVDEVPGNVELAQEQDPHDLENLDFVVYPAEFAVAENGAVWLTDANLKHRVVFFITQFLVIVLSKTEIVHTMHEAYARANVPQPGFGLFLSGPSKTADIEQSLVIGAHGCREFQLYLV